MIPNRTLANKCLLALACLGMLSVYVDRVVRVYLAERSADASQGADRISGLERSIRWAPDNAEFPHLLGLRLSASAQDIDGSRAIANLRKAVNLNPNRGYYWLDLASVYQVTGNVAQQNDAAAAAVKAEPGNPEVAAEAGQFFLASGDVDRAFPLFKQALEKNSDAAGAIFRVCWKQTPNANLLIARVIPANPELQLTFLRMLAEQDESTAASEVWQSIVTAHKSFSPQLSFFYFEYLLQQHDVAGFQRDWNQLASLAPAMRAYLPNENLIVDPSFEQPLLNWGFDWRQRPADHVAAAIDEKVAHSGVRSLSVAYDGSPANDSGWTQFIPVLANSDYEFSAWIKSEEVTSSSGPRIALVDAYSGDILLITDDVLDTHPWQQIEGTLHVPEDTKLLAVKFVRIPSNTRIRGRVWIDDLRLAKK